MESVVGMSINYMKDFVDDESQDVGFPSGQVKIPRNFPEISIRKLHSTWWNHFCRLEIFFSCQVMELAPNLSRYFGNFQEIYENFRLLPNRNILTLHLSSEFQRLMSSSAGNPLSTTITSWYFSFDFQVGLSWKDVEESEVKKGVELVDLRTKMRHVKKLSIRKLRCRRTSEMMKSLMKFREVRRIFLRIFSLGNRLCSENVF